MRKTWQKGLIFIQKKVVILGMALFLCTGCKSGEASSELTEITEDMSVQKQTDGAESGQDKSNGNTRKDDSTEDDKSVNGENTDPEDVKASSTGTEIFVHVCGAVANPGVYRLPADSRLYEAISAAGGLKEDAEDTSLNQASLVTDGQQIYVPTKEEVKNGTFGGAPGEGTVKNTESSDGKININTADKTQLVTLPGIGESKAAAIITYRETHGSFQSIEELMEINGIKEGVFQKIRDMITI